MATLPPPPRSLAHGLQIAPTADRATLTPEQKRFNALIRQIEQARRALAAWRDGVPRYLQAYTRVIVPLSTALTAARRERVLAFDRLLDEPGWNRIELTTLRELACDGVAQLLESADEEDAELKALFDKHAEVDFDTDQQASRQAMKGLVEEMTGLDLGDDADFASDDDLMRRMHEKLAEAQADGEAEHGAAPRRRKTVAQARREAEAQLASQSIREVFRKLASALHPDREVDAVQREAKTALMQKVNQAYAANDLLTLLELQLQIEQVDAGHIAQASVQRLKHYNKVLAEQLAELKAETARLETRFRMDFGLGLGWGLNPARLDDLIAPNARACRDGVAAIQRDLRALADRATARRWLKRERQRMREAEFDDDVFF